MTTSIKSI